MKRITKTLFVFFVMTSFAFSALANDAGVNYEKEVNREWTVIEMFTVNPFAGGLASDGEYIYIGAYGGGYSDEMHRFDPSTGELIMLFDDAVVNQSLGLTYDGEYLWTINRVGFNPSFALQFDMEGNEVSQFALPNTYMSGIAYDDGNFWVATYNPNPGTIHLMDDQGNEISSFVPPTDQPWDIAIQGDTIWIVDFWNDFIHAVETDGTLIQSFPYDDHRATGIYHDGNFLWYIGRTSQGVSTLYKVDPFGTGTPVIVVPPSHHFGNVTLGDDEVWMMNIQNPGTGDLTISDITFPDGVTAFSVDESFPFTIEAGSSQSVAVTFTPDEIHMYEEIMTIHSDDPASLTTEVTLTGNGLASGPFLVAEQEVIEYGEARLKSTTRLYMELQNMGDEPLVLSDIELSSNDFYWDWRVEFPLTLDPVETTALALWFWPQNPGLIEEEATLLFNNPDQSPYIIELTGSSEDLEYPLGTVLWDITLPGPTFQNPRAIMSVSDVTDDGIPDVLICTRGLELQLYNGNASGTPDLIWATEIGTVEYPKALAELDDVNEDGFNDFVIGTAYGDRAVTAVSPRTGEIIWRFETNLWGGGGWVYMVDVKYDFNGNGYRDVLAAAGDDGDGTGPRRVFLLNGKTGDLIWDTSMGGAAYSVLAVEDFTGDGVPDVIGGGQTPGQQGKVIAINGATGSIEWEYLTSGSSVWALEQIDDITGNGIRDIIAGTFNGFYYLMDVTNGDLQHSGSLGGVLILDFWQAGDLNGDGYMDIFPANSTSPHAVAISGQDGQIIWSTQVADQPWSIAPTRDISGDGINDVAVGTLFNNNWVYFLSGSDGDVLDSIPMPAAVDAIRAIPDITGDNSMEVVAAARNNYVVALSGGVKVDFDYYDVTFIVEDDVTGDPIEGALVHIPQTAHSIPTDENGMVVINLAEGDYEYVISKEGYLTADGTFALFGEDKTIEVTLFPDVWPEYYDVMFFVIDNEDPANPIEGAEIEILQLGIILTTNEDGYATHHFSSNNYDYIVSKEDFFDEEGSFEVVDEDLTIEVIMTPDDTGIFGPEGSGLFSISNYPNPFSDYTNIVIKLGEPTEVSVYVYDMNIRRFNIMKPETLPAGEHTIQWDGKGPNREKLIDGIYIYEIITEDGIFRDRMMMLRN